MLLKNFRGITWTWVMPGAYKALVKVAYQPWYETRENPFTMTRKGEGIEDFTFHKLRHTAINNWRLQEHNYFRIMAVTAYKTMRVVKQYNTVNKEESEALVGEKIWPNDTSDTKDFQARKPTPP